LAILNSAKLTHFSLKRLALKLFFTGSFHKAISFSNYKNIIQTSLSHVRIDLADIDKPYQRFDVYLMRGQTDKTIFQKSITAFLNLSANKVSIFQIRLFSCHFCRVLLVFILHLSIPHFKEPPTLISRSHSRFPYFVATQWINLHYTIDTHPSMVPRPTRAN
jgi:hypothetical protein